MGGKPTDAELLHGLRRDPQLVGVVYDRYARRLVGYLRQAGASDQAALDAVQETFARLIVHAKRIRPAPDGTLWPWLATTGRNLVRDSQRRGAVDAQARRRLGLSVADGELTDSDERLEAEGQRARLRLALGRLPDEQLSAVADRVVRERDYPEIAAESGVSEQTIRQRVSRGLRTMQVFLEGGNS